MFKFLWKVLPDNYKFSVAFKKVSWTIAKTAISLVAGTKIGSQVPPEQWMIVTEVSAALIAGALKFVHDWAKVKWPDNDWL